LPQSSDGSWDGGSSIFLALAPSYRDQLSREDEKWKRALEQEGMRPDFEAIQEGINIILILISSDDDASV
jgi:hypothetical protein